MDISLFCIILVLWKKGLEMLNVFDKFALSLKPFLDMTGYEPKTTFWQDFCIAEPFGEKAIRDTFKRAFNEWKNDKVYITELTMILNWKAWQHSETNHQLGLLYQELWNEVDTWCCHNLKGEDLDYFFRTTD